MKGFFFFFPFFPGIKLKLAAKCNQGDQFRLIVCEHNLYFHWDPPRGVPSLKGHDEIEEIIEEICKSYR